MNDEAAASIRSQAVENVDARHGYTLEFSNQPNCHAIEYDEEEARLMAEHTPEPSAGSTVSDTSSRA